MYGGRRIQLDEFLTWALGGGKLLDSRPGRFTSGERAPGSGWTGGWVGPRAALYTVAKVKIIPFLSLPGILVLMLITL